MKRLRNFLFRLFGISLLLVPVLSPLQKAYQQALAAVSSLLASAVLEMERLPYDGSGSAFTFLVLFLAIPEMEVKKRVGRAAFGITVFFGSDFFINAIWPYLKTPQPSLLNMAVPYGWLVVAHYLLPFLLWFILAFRQIEGLCRHDATEPKTS